MRRIVDFLTSFRAPWLLAIGAAACMSFFAVWWGSLNQDDGWYLRSDIVWAKPNPMPESIVDA